MNLCDGCQTEVAGSLLVCPSCRRLVHGQRLRDLIAAAETATDPTTARDRFAEALPLVPPGTRQHQWLGERLSQIDTAQTDTAQTDTTPKDTAGSDRTKPPVSEASHLGGKSGAAVIAVGLLLWKFKAIAGFVLTKGKLLLLGLTKSSTLFTMLLSFGVYWTAWGWPFALGLVLSIYVHEMGHVSALRHFGLPATAPMFIPGIGAVVRMQQAPKGPYEDARIGLAGPLWGLGAALVAGGVHLATGSALWAAVAQVGAWINLFNLLPIWQLDGGRGLGALNRPQRLVLVAAIGAAYFATGEGLLLLLLLAAGVRAVTGTAPPRPDHPVLALFIALIAALSAMTLIPVVLPRP